MNYFDVLAIMLTAVCLLTDLGRRKIYNKLLVPFILAGFFGHLYFYGVRGLAGGAAGLLTGLVLLIVPFALRQIGAGDVKLLGALGAIKGPSFALLVFLGAAFAGGLFACIVLFRRGRLLFSLRSIGYGALCYLARVPAPYAFNTLDKAAPRETLPFTVAIAAGVFAAFLFPGG